MEVIERATAFPPIAAARFRAFAVSTDLSRTAELAVRFVSETDPMDVQSSAVSNEIGRA